MATQFKQLIRHICIVDNFVRSPADNFEKWCVFKVVECISSDLQVTSLHGHYAYRSSDLQVYMDIMHIAVVIYKSTWTSILTIQVFDNLKTAALCSAEMTAITACRLLSSQSF